jgi:hypothetical protein
MSDFDTLWINNTYLNVILLYNFKIIFNVKHFKNTQVKHNWIPFFFSKQNAMIDFADRLFKSVSNHGNLKNILQNVISNLLVYD